MKGKNVWNTHRRQFLQSLAAVVAGFGLPASAPGQASPPKQVRCATSFGYFVIPAMLITTWSAGAP
jgi:hypothetical protein